MELVDHPAADNAQMAAALDAVPEAEVMLADFLPDAQPGAAPTGRATRSGWSRPPDSLPTEVRDAAGRRVANLRWIQLPRWA